MKRLTEMSALLSVFLIPLYFLRFNLAGIPTNPFEIAVAISFLLTLYARPAQIKWGSLWPCLILFSAFISVFFSPDLEDALGYFKGLFLIPIIFYWVLINNFDGGNYKKIGWPIFLSLTLTTFYSFFQYLDVIGLRFYQKTDPIAFSQYLGADRRAFGFFESPNFLVMFLVPMFFLSAIVYQNLKTRWKRALANCVLVLAVLMIIWTDSEAGLAAFILTGLGWLIYRLSQRWQKLVLKTVINLSFPIISIMILSANLMVFYYKYDEARSQIYRYSLELLKHHWFFPIGLGDFQNKIGTLVSNDYYFQVFYLRYALHPHNLFLSVWLYLGLYGLAFFVINIYKFFTSIRNLAPIIREPLALSMLAILIHGLYDTTYFKNDLAAVFWLIIALSQIANMKQIGHFE